MLKELFISEVRVNLLKFLIKNFTQEFHVRALVRELGLEINAVRRELEKLNNLNKLFGMFYIIRE
jgi:predicted AAA+ superfamily ATPase